MLYFFLENDILIVQDKISLRKGKKFMFDTTQIGKRISEFRKAKDMTQYELADKLSISFQAVSNWERGNSMPDISKLPELAEIFGVTIDDIVGHNNTVLHDVISSQSPNANEYSDADISEAAYLLKPSQIEDILINTDYHPRVLSTVLPFLSDKTIEEITDEHIKNGKSVAVLLPFLHYEKIEELERIATENGESITMFMPFLRESAIKAFAFEAFEHGGISETSVFLPFMNEADI